MKKFITLLLFAYIPTASAQVLFGSKTCQKNFSGEPLSVCQNAVKGDPKAQYIIARYFADPNNEGHANFKYSFHWHLKLSRSILKNNLDDDPYIETLYNTGIFYHQGLGTDKNDKKAFFWFLKASEKGSAHAMVKLAHAYEVGLGTDKSPQKANKWLRKAIDLKNTEAEVVMARKMLQGTGGVAQDTTAGLSLLKSAADKKSPQAHLLLGSLYDTGKMVSRDQAEAKMHYGEACRGNLLMACRLYFELDSQLEFAQELGTKR